VRAFSAVVLCMLALAGSAGTARPAQPTASHIVFTSTRDGDRDVYAVNADGSHLTALTHNRLYESGRLSPDGRRLIVERSRIGGPTALVLVSARGRRQQKLVSGRHVYMGSFSPDGHWLSFGSGDSISAIQTNGRGRRVISRNGDYGAVDWSPDSTSLLLRGVHDDRSSDLAIVRRDGSQLHVIAQDVDDAAWGRGGIAVVHGTAPHQTLSVVDAEGGRPHQLLTDGEIRVAGWSADGTRLAAIDEIGGRDEVLYFNADSGRTETVLTADYVVDAVWSPTGDRLAITATYLDEESIFILTPFPWSQLAVLHPPAGFAVDKLAWSPNGDQIAFASGYRLFVTDADGTQQRTLANHGDPVLVGWASGRA
jgi:Tol biopolymer transport system component